VEPKDNRRELWLLLAILTLTTVLRVGWPTLKEFKFDEARLQALALELTREGHVPLIGVPSSAGFDHSPLSVYLYAPAFLFTTSPIPATVLGGLVNVAAVALCWWLSRRWAGGGRWAAIVTALLFAVSPWAVAFSRKIWQVAFVPLLAIVFVALMISALVSEPARHSSKGRRWHLTWALVVFAVLVQVHPSAVALALAAVLWLVVFRRSIRLAPLLVGVAGGAITTIPFATHQIQSDWPVMNALRALPEAIWDLSAVRLGWESITGQGIRALAGQAYPRLTIVPCLEAVFPLVGWLTVLGTLWLAWRAVTGWRAQDKARQQAARVDFVLLTWLVIPIAFNLRHSLDLYLHSFALAMPAAFLISGRIVEVVFRKWSAPLLKTLVLLGIGLVAAAQLLALVLMGRFVADHDTTGGFGTPLGHYLGTVEDVLTMAEEAGAAEVLVVGQGDSAVVNETPAIFDVLLRDRAAYRFVDGQSAAVFPPHPALALLSPEAGEATLWYESRPTRDLQHGYRVVSLDGSRPQDELSPVVGPRVFQNGVELQGYLWQAPGQPGGDARLWLLWQVLWLNPDDTHFFVHLLGEEDQIQGQQDAVGYPTVYRNKGDRILSVFDITSPEQVPMKPEWARVGLYTYPEVVNVPVIDEAGNPVADAVLMGPLDREP
jgi:hypothetical protein